MAIHHSVRGMMSDHTIFPRWDKLNSRRNYVLIFYFLSYRDSVSIATECQHRPTSFNWTRTRVGLNIFHRHAYRWATHKSLCVNIFITADWFLIIGCILIDWLWCLGCKILIIEPHYGSAQAIRSVFIWVFPAMQFVNKQPVN